MTSIVDLLDLLADYQGQRDLLELQKNDLISHVKAPDEVLEAQAEINRRKRAIDSAYQARQMELTMEKQKAMATVVIPPEIQAVYAAIEAQRLEIERAYTQDNSAAWGDACRYKEQVDKELTDGVAAIYAEIEQRRNDIEVEYSDKAAGVLDNIAKLTAEIKGAVVQEGKTVKGKFWQAVYVKGRVSWNTDMLDGMIVAFPALEKARKCGEPSVTLRKV